MELKGQNCLHFNKKTKMREGEKSNRESVEIWRVGVFQSI